MGPTIERAAPKLVNAATEDPKLPFWFLSMPTPFDLEGLNAYGNTSIGKMNV